MTYSFRCGFFCWTIWWWQHFVLVTDYHCHCCTKVDTDETGGQTKVTRKPKKAKKEKPATLEFAKYSVLCQYSDERPDISAADLGADALGDAIIGRIFTDEGGNKDLPQRILVKVLFPRLQAQSQSKLKVEMSHELLVVSAPTYRRLEIFLPLPIKQDSVIANFDGLVRCLWRCGDG